MFKKLTNHFQWRRELRNWAEPIARQTGLSTDWLIADCESFWSDHAIRREEYEAYALWSQPAALRDNFLGLNEERIYLDVLNPKKYYILSRNKFFAHELFEQMGIRTTDLLCCYYPDGLSSPDRRIVTDLNGVKEVLRQKQADRFVVKAAEGAHGERVELFDRREFDPSLLGTEPLLFERVVRQTAQFAAFNPSSVNTVRFMTLLYPDGQARIIATFVKIGRSGRCVDNAGSGGNVDACIEVETGRLQYAIQYDGLQKIRDIDRHPDTGAQLNGVVVENWEAIKAEVCRFQQAFPYCKAAGWDVAITEEGPLIIEVNDFWDMTGQLFIRRGWRREVRDCYLAWKATGREWEMGRGLNRLSAKRIKHILEN